MRRFEFPKKSPQPPFAKGGNCILALGAESAGNFSVFTAPTLIKGVGGIYFSPDFGDLLDEKNFKNFQTAVLKFLKKYKLKPNIILTDLHPEYKTTLWGAELAKKYKAEHTQIQHHIAHIFSAIGEQTLKAKSYKLTANTIGIALDGTGYGTDGKIWGGEIFECQMSNVKCRIDRIGHLENQVMIGGDLAVREPARMIISILNKLTTYNLQLTTYQKKDFVYNFVKKFYTRNEFELLYNQLQNNFNCVETSSTGRVLDAVSLLLGFCNNKRNYKHEPIDLLEKNSTVPYKFPPLIKGDRGIYILQTTPLFEYLIKNIHKDKRRLAATAQLYIAEGLYEIIKKNHNTIPSTRDIIHNTYIAGGISNNKIISSYFESKDVVVNKKVPRGDAGLSFGQIIYYLPNFKKLASQILT